MSSIAVAATLMGGLGLAFGAILAIAYRVLRVEEDPRIELVEKMLPGTNCGACGEPGCHGFAEKLVEGAHKPSRCTVSNAAAHSAIADALGVDAGDEEKRVARLACAGGRDKARQHARYQGFTTCRAAHVVGGGGKDCQWGCLGLSDCAVACTFDAIHMTAEALPLVDVDLCTACGDCVDACPRGLFEVLPMSRRLLVQCKALVGGDAARALCSVACDGCGRCASDAAPGLIHIERTLAVVDAKRSADESPRAVLRCPTGAIAWVEGAQLGKARRRLPVLEASP